MAFRVRKLFGTFEKRAPGSKQTTYYCRLTTRVRVKNFLALSVVINLGLKIGPGPVKRPLLVTYFFSSPILDLPRGYRRKFIFYPQVAKSKFHILPPSGSSHNPPPPGTNSSFAPACNLNPHLPEMLYFLQPFLVTTSYIHHGFSFFFPLPSGNFGLWLDEDLYHGSSHPCTTYNNVQLSSREDFLCSGLEAWTFV